MTNSLQLNSSTVMCGLATQSWTPTITGLYTCDFKMFIPYFAAGTPAQSTVIANNKQTVTVTGDTSGSLNSTYWTFYTSGNAYGYYVWYNINSAGVDPAPGGGLIGIEVSAATSANSTTIGGDTRTAITAAVPYVTITGTTSAVTIAQNYGGACTAAADSSGAATGFTFATSSPVGTFGTPAASGLVVQITYNGSVVSTTAFPTPTQPIMSGYASIQATAGDAITVVTSSLSTADAGLNAVKGIINLFQGQGQ